MFDPSGIKATPAPPLSEDTDVPFPSSGPLDVSEDESQVGSTINTTGYGWGGYV